MPAMLAGAACRGHPRNHLSVIRLTLTLPERLIRHPRNPPHPEMTAAATYRSVFRPGLFAGQVIWVTGGGSGIGRCVAHELASLGATVVISGRTQEKLARVAAEITEDGGCCRHPGLRHPRRGGGQGRGGRGRRPPWPGGRPGQQRRRPVPGAADGDQQEGLRRRGRQQPHRRLPDDARAVQPEHAAARRRDRQHDRRFPQRHARHGSQRRGARRA